MTFEGQYLTYAEYQALGGSAIGEMPFNLLEFEARRKIDIRTQNRLINVAYNDLPQAVKLCEYNMINSINSYLQTTANMSNGGNIKSENTDGYSISYISASEIKDVVISKNTELEDIIRTYLLELVFNGQHLMYLGVD